MKTRVLLTQLSILCLITLTLPAAIHAGPICTDPLGCVVIGPGDPIHIAYALVLDGPNSPLGIDERNGLEVAVSDARGQIMGHDIRLDGVSSGCNYEGGYAAGKALAADLSIVAVVGTSCSSDARAAARLLSAAGFVMISPSNTAPDLTEPGNPNNFPGYLRTAQNDIVLGSRAAQYAYRQLGATSAAIIDDGSPYAVYQREAFAEEFTRLGGTVTAQEAIDPEQANMGEVLAGIASGAPKVLFLPVFMPAGGHIINQASTMPGMEGTYLMGTDSLLTPDVVTATDTSIDGFMVTSADFSHNSADYFESFLPAYQARFGDPTSPFHAHAYDAFMVLKAAIQRVAIVDENGGLIIGRQALRNAIYSTRVFPGLTGDLTCGATGDCADPHIAVYTYHAGQFPPEYTWPQTSETVNPWRRCDIRRR